MRVFSRPSHLDNSIYLVTSAGEPSYGPPMGEDTRYVILDISPRYQYRVLQGDIGTVQVGLVCLYLFIRAVPGEHHFWIGMHWLTEGLLSTLYERTPLFFARNLKYR